ncbi:MAG: class I SAM-dependent methyltransferase [Spirochaetes bacterium]|nr:class I SAM-dependent methyltransferase [Spirochaetota bacterium]
MPKIYPPEHVERHAQMLGNRVKKRYEHLAKRFAREQIDCFRLYDWDIPEIRAVVDWYAGHLVVSEYERLQTGPDWLPRMARAVGEAMNVPPEKVFTKKRRTRTADGERYSAVGSGEWDHEAESRPTNDFRAAAEIAPRPDVRFPVRERDLKLWVNLGDFLDTGLYSDHRNTRQLVRGLAPGSDFLNLFAYTGAFTLAAAAGGAKTTTTVDRNATYTDWARENLALSGLSGPQHRLVQYDVEEFLDRTAREKTRYNLAVIDPPSFFTDRTKGTAFDISLDHPRLLEKVLKVMVTGGIVFFSTNHQRFEPAMEGLRVSSNTELTPGTIPDDYRNRQVHRCWKLVAL